MQIEVIADEHAMLLRRSNPAGMNFFFNRHYPALCFFAEKLIGNKTEAEDLVKEAFIKLWERRTNFETSQNIKAFLYITTRNAGLNVLKKNKRKEEGNLEFAYLSTSSSFPITNEIIRAELIGQIYFEIEKLPAKRKQIFELCYFANLKNNEVAEHLGISLNTVKTQKNRAISFLRSRLCI